MHAAVDSFQEEGSVAGTSTTSFDDLLDESIFSEMPSEFMQKKNLIEKQGMVKPQKVEIGETGVICADLNGL
jgi:hypothetical protein